MPELMVGTSLFKTVPPGVKIEGTKASTSGEGDLEE